MNELDRDVVELPAAMLRRVDDLLDRQTGSERTPS
jgi:metal-responsive CopG/Arc/MetJ family transcriptional regulator